MQETIIALLTIILVVLLLTAIFQLVYLFAGNEIRAILAKLKKFKKSGLVQLESIMSFINSLASILAKMSSEKIGALIVIENKDSLTPYINIGNKVDSSFFPELVSTVFYNKKSPLHDGAMIVRNWRIVSVSSYLPMTRKVVNVKYGARHRAAFGISEKTDALAFVVSETTGDITFAHLDEFKTLSSTPDKLASEIAKIFASYGLIEIIHKNKKIDISNEIVNYNKPKVSNKRGSNK